LGGAAVRLLLAKNYDVVAIASPAEYVDSTALAALGAKLESVTLNQEDRVGERRLGEIAKGARLVVVPKILDASTRALIALEQAAPERCVFISSNNVGVDPTNHRFSGFASAEARVVASRLIWTLLRPTMVYGHADDGNLSILAQRLKSGRWTPLPEGAKTMHQPIHFEDVARAAIAVGEWPQGAHRTIPLGGPQTIDLATLYELVAEIAEARARAKLVPVSRLRLAARAASLIGVHYPVSVDQLDRLGRRRTASTPDDLPADAHPQISLHEGLSRLAAELAQLDGTRLGAQLALRSSPELPS
jgi:uncharacterized protein YbjT (DUF2867 family)